MTKHNSYFSLHKTILSSGLDQGAINAQVNPF